MIDHQPAQKKGQLLITSQKIAQYLDQLKKQGASESTIKRKEASLNKFAKWVKREYGQEEEALKIASPKPKKISENSSLPEAYKADKKASPLFKYFSFFIIALLVGSLGWGIYTQFIARPPEEPSLAALPTLPPNLISFQGRLTNSVGTPIHATVSASFKIYDVDEGGSALWSETKDITTNADGIFNTMLGSSNPIDPAIFADNVNLWLGITISGDDEMEPRQQIATVGYAYNSRYLQGYSATTSATAETIPVINAAGNLILASSSPSIESTSGTFGLKGEAITIQSTGGVGGGDILIQPNADTEGRVIVYSGTTSDNSFTVQNASITTGTLIYAEAGTTGTGYDLLKLASGSPLTTKFAVDYAGNTDIAGNLTVSSSGFFGGNVGIGTTSPDYRLDILGGTGVVAQFSGRVIGGDAVNNNEFITKGQLGSVGVTSVTGTQYEVLANDTYGVGQTGPVTLTTPSDFRAPGTVTATTGLYTGAGAGTLRIDASGNLSNIGTISSAYLNTGASYVDLVSSAELRVGGTSVLTPSRALQNITTISSSGNITSSGGVLSMGGTGSNYFAGNVGIGTTSPSFKLQLAGSGNLLSIGDTAGNTFFSVTDSLITSNLPHTFTSSGDVSMAYNLIFTNQASSKIESYGPLSIVAGESHESNNLTLKTYNAGKLILDSANLWADGTNVGIGTTDPSYTLDVNGDIGLASGSDLYLGGVGLGSTAGAGLVGMDNAGLTYVSSSSVQGGIADLDGAISSVSGDIRWVMTGNTGTPQIVGAGQTASFLGGTGISTSVGATRQLTIDFDTTWGDGRYIQDQFSSAQSADFWIDGVGLVGTRLGIGDTHPDYSLYTTGNLGVGGTANLAQLTASRLVTSDANKNLVSTISADNLRASVSGTTGTGSLVFGTSPTITTRLGIGSTSASYNLNVDGNAYISTNLNLGVGLTTPAFTMVTGAGTNKVFTSDASGNASWSDITSVGVGGSGTTSYLSKWISGSTLGNSSIYESDNNVGIGGTAPSTSPSLYVGADGKVGVGTTGPNYKLHIATDGSYGSSQGIRLGSVNIYEINNGRIQIGSALSVWGDRIVTSPNANYPMILKAAGSLTKAVFTGYYNDSGIGFSGTDVGIISNNENVITVKTGGSVGIGTTNPANFKLQVAGHVGPDADSTYNLGSDSIRWANIYADNIYGAVSGSVSFADITSGDNSDATMTVSGSASLDYTGSGAINASSLQGATWGAPLGIGTTTPGVGYFTSLSASTSLTTPLVDNSGSLGIGTSNQTGLTLGRSGATTTINGSSIVLGTQASSTTHAVRADRSLIAGSGLTGGGNLTADRTFNVGAGNGITVNSDDVAVNQGYNFAWTGTQSWSNTATFNGNLLFGGSTGILSSGGNVGIGHTSPSFKLQIAGSGNLLSIGDTAGNTFFSVTDSLITSNLPHTFTSSGDVSMAYNLLFTNPTASYVRSSAPLYIEAGEVYDSSNLTLRTYNTGNIILESANLWADGASVGIGTTSPSYKLDVNGDIGLASGSDLYLGGVGLGSTGGAALVGMDNAGLTYVSSSSVQGGIADLDGAISSVSGDIRWVMTGNTGTPQIVGAGQTASFLGGTGISTSVGATRQLTINFDTTWGDGRYIQDQFSSAQSADFWIDGVGLVGTRLGVGDTHPDYSLYTTGNLGVGGTAYFAGNVGIGTSDPGSALEVAGDVLATSFSIGSSTLGSSEFGYLDGQNQSVFTTSDVTFNDVSITNPANIYNLSHNSFADYVANEHIDWTGASSNFSTSGTGYFGGSLNLGVGLTTPAFTMVTGAGANKVFTSDASGNASWSDITSIGVGGSGTTNYLPKWTAGAILGDSVLYESGGNIGIGTTVTSAARITLADHTTATGGIRFRTAATAVDLYSRASAVLTTAANFEAGSYRVGTTEVISSGRIIKAADGTASAPAFSFSADTNTGIYRGGTDILRLATAGTDRLTILANGNVGIGTTNPSEKLQIHQGALNFTTTGVAAIDRIKFNEVTSVVHTFYTDYSGTGASGNDLILKSDTNDPIMVWERGGNVGVGTGSPEYSLDVRSSAGGSIGIGGGTTVTGILGWEISPTYTTFLKASNASYNLGLRAGNSSTDQVTIKTDGNVGIGTTNPGSFKLNVAGNTYLDGTLTTTEAISAPTSTNTINNLVINSGTITSGTWQATAIGANYGGTGQTAYSTGDLLYASSSSALSKRGIGATGQVLTVSGGVPVWGDIDISGSGGVTGSGTENYLARWTSASNISTGVTRDDGTNVGIGVAPGTYKLNVSGTANISSSLYLSGNERFNSSGALIPHTVSSTTKFTNLNADLLDGYNTSMSASNSTVAVRNASGYLYANYFNTTANVTSTSASHFAIQTGSDSFIRWQTPANARASLGLVPGGDGDIWVEKAGDTMTGTLNFSGVTNDITTSGSEHLALMPGGNVGIGTGSPGAKLEITDGTLKATNTQGDYYTNLYLGAVNNRDAYVILIQRTGMSTGYKQGTIVGKRHRHGATSTADFTVHSSNNPTDHALIESNFFTTAYGGKPYELVTVEYNSEEYIALKYDGGDYGGHEHGIWFTGFNKEVTGENLTVVSYYRYGTGTLNAEIENSLTPFSTASNKYISGNVGIGTTNPGLYKLNVAGNSYIGGTLTTTGAISAPTSTNTINNLVINSGTITSGTWQATAIGANYGGTGQTAYSTGDLIYASSSSALSRRGIGATGQVLTVSGGVPVWSNPAISGSGSGSGSGGQATFWTGSDSISGDDAFWWDNTNKSLGIGGTPNSTYKLDVLTGEIRGGKFVDGSNPNYYLDPAEAVSLTTAGKAGIGTDSPGYKLHVVGDALITERLGIGSTNPSYPLNVEGTSRFTNNLTVTSGGVSVTGNSTITGTLSSLTGLTSYGTITFSGLTANRFVTTGTGGTLGTSATLANLVSSLSDVSGSTGTTNLVLSASPTFTGNVSFPGSGIWNSSGNVGIGTADPGYKLHVNGTANIGSSLYVAGNQRFNSSGALIPHTVSSTTKFTNLNADMVDGYSYSSSWPNDPNTVLRSNSTTNYIPKWNGTYTLTNSLIYDNGTNVGIGTTEPQSRLHVDYYQVNNIIASFTSSIGPSNWNGIALGYPGYSKGGILFERTASYGRGNLYFASDDAADTNMVDINDVKMTVTYGGNVGIGTTAPQTKLHVKGNTLIEGDLSLDRDDLNALAMNPSMVPNWSFEVHNSSDDIPDGWFGWGQSGTYSRTRTSSQRRHGSYSLAIYATSGSYAAVRSSCIPVTPGQTYQYAMSVKSSVATTKGLIWRVLKYTDSRCTTDDGYSELISFDAGVGTSWSQKTQTGIAVGSGTRGISIQVFNYYPNVNATFYFDRFVVRESAYNSTDLAEMVPAENEKIDQAEIVSIDKETGKVKLSTRPYDKKIFGIVSTQPGIILQNENEIQPKATVALAGRVPVKISTTNGNIQPGDPITSSSLPGIGTKATQAGTIVGNAMEGTENWNEAICPAVSSLNDINWPKDDGLNPEKPCYKLPDGTYVGKIMAFVNTSWSDSQVYLTDSGDIKLIGETTEETKIYQVKDKENNPITRIGAFGEAVIGKIRSGLIETNSLVADTVTARRLKTEKLVSPVIETEKIVTSNSQLVISNPEGEKTAEFNTETKKTTLFGDLQVERGLKSATAEVGKITGEQAGFGELISATAEIGQLNAQGASFGDLLAQNVGIGQLEAESVKTEKLDVAQDATIAGTLYVDRVIARGGGFGELLAKDISMDSLRSIVREEINRTQDETGENTGFNGIEEGEEAHGIEQEKAGLIQDDGELDIDALLAEVEGWLNLNTNGDLPVDEEITVPENQISTFADNFIHQGNLTVLGKTTMGNVFIADQLIVGQIVIADNSLSNPNGTIYLQKEGLGGIDILAGKFMIDTNGNVFIAQHLTVGGDLVAGNIRPHEGENLVFDLANNIGQGDGMGSFASAQDDGGETAQDDEEETAQDDGGGFGKLLVKGINQETVAQIDASGSAQFAGTVRADSLAISRPEENEEDLIIAASENFDNINIWAPGIVTNASAGKATLPVGQTDLVIFNDRLADESMVYLTPTSDTQNQVLYVKAKVTRDETGLGEDQQVHGIKQDGKNYFVVGINQAINEEVKFNWWIIN